MKKEVYTVFVDGKEYSKVYRRFKKPLCEMIISSLRSIPSLMRANITIERIY